MRGGARAAILLALAAGCRSPLRDLRPEGPPALAPVEVRVEDHSRRLKHLKAPAPGEADSPEARRAALASYADWLREAATWEAAARGLELRPDAPWSLELVVTDLAELRTSYLVLGIASGVAWGVGTGLATHDPRLAWGLGTYELAEESAFWLGGASLFSAWSAPCVVRARLCGRGGGKPLWKETYYELHGRGWLEGLPEPLRKDRTVQLRASLQEAVHRAFRDLQAIPGFPALPDRKHLPPTALAQVRERLTSGRTAP